jgi:uncharacterized protein (DUF697 family)
VANPLKLANLWRVVREVDLQTIRKQALAPFDLLIAGESIADADRLRALLGHGDRPPHAFVRTAAIDTVIPGVTPSAAILLAPIVPSPAVDSVAHGLRKARVPVVVVHVTGASVGSAANVAGQVVVRALDEEGAVVIAAALLPLVADDQRLALAHQLPPFRAPLYEITIDETARANATYALTTGVAESVPILTVPLNLGDMVILTKNQLLMSYRLVLASGRDGEPRRLVTEILGVLGGGLLFRQLARQLVGLIPIAGIVPKVAIAYGGTWAIGRAIVLWVTEGRSVTEDTLRALGADGLERGRQVARDLVQRARTQAGSAASRWDRFRSHLPGLSRRQPGRPASPSKE